MLCCAFFVARCCHALHNLERVALFSLRALLSMLRHLERVARFSLRAAQHRYYSTADALILPCKVSPASSHRELYQIKKDEALRRRPFRFRFFFKLLSIRFDFELLSEQKQAEYERKQSYCLDDTDNNEVVSCTFSCCAESV